MTDPVNRPVRLAALAGVVTVGLALAGCSGDGGEGESSSAAPSATSVSSESASPDGSSSASPSSSASGSYEPATETSPAKNVPVPEMPEAAKEPTEAGVEAALEHWWEAGYYLQLSGNPGPLNAISSESCIICDELTSDWTGIYSAGGWSTGADPAIPKLVISLENEGESATMIFESEEGPSSLYKPGGEEVEPEEADKTFRANWSGMASFDASRGHWIIDEIIAQDDLDAND